MAIESSLVQAEMVEAGEFPALANQYQVTGVPDTSVNHGANKVVGAVPEEHLVNAIKEALGK